MTDDNIAKMLVDEGCNLFSIFRIISKFNIRPGLQFFGFQKHPWTSNFRKSYNDFFNSIGAVNYSESDDAILTIAKTRMEQYTED